MAKLIDILARELSEFKARIVEQGKNGIVFNSENGRTIGLFELAEDLAISRVKFEEWQAAVDALNAPKVVEWDGFGLPSIGLTVEVKRGECAWIKKDEWQIGKTATVMSSFLNSRGIEIASVQFPGGHCECILARCLSPIRTAEQVAAEEREAEDNEVMSRYLSLSDCNKGILGHSPERVIIGLMRIMGYRKQ